MKYFLSTASGQNEKTNYNLCGVIGGVSEDEVRGKVVNGFNEMYPGIPIGKITLSRISKSQIENVLKDITDD